MKSEMMKNVTRGLNRVAFQLKKKSPELLLIGGVACGVACVVTACKATRKVDTILEEAKDAVDKIHEVKDHPEKYDAEYSEEDAKKDLAVTYFQTGLKLAKLYAPTIALGALSVTAILGSHNIMKKRNIALAAAYATVDKSFKDYRSRVVERFGDDLDKELKYNIKAKEVEETITDEDGKEQTVKKNINVVENASDISEYAKFFDSASINWEKNSETNLMFLRAQQQYANDLLVARGHLFLNEVYDMLGIERTKAGQVVGWIYDPKNPNGDNYVDFGIYDVNKPKNRDFVNGYEPVILLDFNVDGNIWDKM